MNPRYTLQPIKPGHRVFCIGSRKCLAPAIMSVLDEGYPTGLAYCGDESHAARVLGHIEARGTLTPVNLRQGAEDGL